MEQDIWPLERDGTIQCQQLTSEYVEQAVNMMEKSFFANENVCKAMGIPNDPEAIAELKELTRAIAEDGVTVIAVDKNRNKVAGACFNKILVKDDPFFEKFVHSWKGRRSLGVIKFMSDIGSMCNLFELCKVDCQFELLFLGILPEYRGKGIGKKLAEISLNIARKLADGFNVKKTVDGQQLSLEPVPKIASSIFTSFITQKIGRQLQFQIAFEKSYELFEFDGKIFAHVIGKETPGLTLEYKHLK